MTLFQQLHGFFLLNGEMTWMYVWASVFAVTCMGFWGVPLWTWTAVLAVMAVGYGLPVPILFGLVGIALLFNLRPLRQLVVSNPILKMFQALKFMPSISETERVALEAGVVWVEGELFSGKPDFNRILNEPYPDLTKEEKAYLDGPVEKLCSMIDDWELWEKRDLPEPVWNYIRKE